MYEFLESQNVEPALIEGLKNFRKFYQLEPEYAERVRKPVFQYYGTEVWNKALAALLNGDHLLLSGPKATGKNVLADHLSYYFNRPCWNVSFHVNTDSSTLIGTDTFVNQEVVLRKGPVYEAALCGGFVVFDEVNMAKNDAVAVVHSALDYRRMIDIPGYEKIKLHEATRFIGTMNYGYVGTRELNEALVSRFMIIDMPVLDQEGIRRLLADRFPLSENALELFATLFIDLQRKSLNAEISSKPIDLRGLMAAISCVRRGLSVREALTMGIVDKTFDTFERQIVMDIIDTLFPKDPGSIFKDEQ